MIITILKINQNYSNNKDYKVKGQKNLVIIVIVKNNKTKITKKNKKINKKNKKIIKKNKLKIKNKITIN